MGIILFNNIPEDLSIVDLEYLGFRPLMGIILFNDTWRVFILHTFVCGLVSVP